MPQAVHTTIGDVARRYRQRKMSEELVDDWFYLVYRVFSFPLVPLLARWGIAPSAVTLVALLLALSLPFVAVIGGWAWLAFAMFAFSVLDAVDGDLARTYGQGSALGAWLDANTDLAYRACAYLGIGLLGGTQTLVPGFGSVAIALGAIVLYLLARMARAPGAARQDKPPAIEPISAGPAQRRSLVAWIYGFLSSLDHALPLLLAVAGWLGRVDGLLMWLLAYAVADYLWSVVTGMRYRY